jgi:mitochondrial fission protein ELM1
MLGQCLIDNLRSNMYYSILASCYIYIYGEDSIEIDTRRTDTGAPLVFRLCSLMGIGQHTAVNPLTC